MRKRSLRALADAVSSKKSEPKDEPEDELEPELDDEDLDEDDDEDLDEDDDEPEDDLGDEDDDEDDDEPEDDGEDQAPPVAAAPPAPTSEPAAGPFQPHPKATHFRLYKMLEGGHREALFWDNGAGVRVSEFPLKDFDVPLMIARWGLGATLTAQWTRREANKGVSVYGFTPAFQLMPPPPGPPPPPPPPPSVLRARARNRRRATRLQAEFSPLDKAVELYAFINESCNATTQLHIARERSAHANELDRQSHYHQLSMQMIQQAFAARQPRGLPPELTEVIQTFANEIQAIKLRLDEDDALPIVQQAPPPTMEDQLRDMFVEVIKAHGPDVAGMALQFVKDKFAKTTTGTPVVDAGASK